MFLSMEQVWKSIRKWSVTSMAFVSLLCQLAYSATVVIIAVPRIYSWLLLEIALSSHHNFIQSFFLIFLNLCYKMIFSYVIFVYSSFWLIFYLPYPLLLNPPPPFSFKHFYHPVFSQYSPLTTFYLSPLLKDPILNQCLLASTGAQC